MTCVAPLFLKSRVTAGRRFQRIFRIILLCILIAFCGLPLAAQATCSLETIVGTYANRGETTIYVQTPNGEVVAPEIHVGLVSFNYDGVMKTHFMGTMNGDPYEADGTGSVTVDENCIATTKVMMTLGDTAYPLITRLLIIDNGDQITNMTISSPYRSVGGNVMKRLSKTPLEQFADLNPCTLDMVRGTYFFNYEGDLFMAVPGAASPVKMHSHMIGTTWVDRMNRMPGTFEFNLAGTVTTGEWTTEGGAIKVSADCTGSVAWRLTGPNAPPTEGLDKFVVVDHGREIWTTSVKGALGKVSNTGVMKQISTVTKE